MKILLFGTGCYAKRIYSMIKNHSLEVDIVGFCDNNSDNWGELYGKKVYAPYEVSGLEVDKIIIMSNMYYNQIKDDLIFWHKISESKIETTQYLLKILMTAKYQNSEDAEIREILAYWKKS